MKTFQIEVIVDRVRRVFEVRGGDKGAARNWLNAQLANSGAIYRFV